MLVCVSLYIIHERDVSIFFIWECENFHRMPLVLVCVSLCIIHERERSGRDYVDGKLHHSGTDSSPVHKQTPYHPSDARLSLSVSFSLFLFTFYV